MNTDPDICRECNGEGGTWSGGVCYECRGQGTYSGAEEFMEQRAAELKAEMDELWEADPNCKHDIQPARGGGVKCTKCSGWFCY